MSMSVATAAPDTPSDVMEATLWVSRGWRAKVVKNEDDDGWAVEMYRVGDAEPALVGPWTMGRDKKNPKPLNPKDFATLVKTASEVLDRAAAAQRAALHKSIDIVVGDAKVRVDLDIAPDEDDPHAIVTATDLGSGEELRRIRVLPNWKLTSRSAQDVVAGKGG